MNKKTNGQIRNVLISCSVIIMLALFGWIARSYSRAATLTAKVNMNTSCIQNNKEKADSNQLAIVAIKKDIEHLNEKADETVKILRRMDKRNGRESQ